MAVKEQILLWQKKANEKLPILFMNKMKKILKNHFFIYKDKFKIYNLVIIILSEISLTVILNLIN